MKHIDVHFAEIALAALLVAITIIHAGIFTANKKIGKWFHTIWGAVYGLVLVALSFIWHSYWLFGVGLLMRFAFYNPLLNGWRGEPVFYLSTSSGKNASWWDKIEIGWGWWYPIICILSAVFFLTLQFFFYE